ncbi:hypothetical protein [Halomicronema sp. CCY15110]|uniref:hypothetical protein n=1 Tax=Halomicronema sp. CCY15110 TaxID=2767773 RepID=UPI001951804D|nr:hypothetical protein [Halomicronema sp. CCY15110]
MDKLSRSKKPLRQNVTIRLQPGIWAATKVSAAQEGRPASDLVEEALAAYLQNLAVIPAA